MTSRPSDKLSFPVTQQHYRIKERVGNAFRLEVPESWKGSDTFTPDRLRLFPNNPLPGQEAERPDGEEVEPNRGVEWVVEKILASRTYYGKLQYQAQWLGWDPDLEWYPASNFKNSPAKLKQYHDENPGKAGPPARLQVWIDAAQNDTFAEDHEDDEKPVAVGDSMRRSKHKKKS